jgi:hypothetical protein
MKPAVHKTTHRRRTSDEMNKALAIVGSHKDTLHVNADDEHVTVLEDAITELLATRHVITTLMQRMDTMQQEAKASLKNIMG